MKKKIYYHDTDCGGVVYYGNYLKYLEEARTEFMEEHGISIKDLAEKDDIYFVVIRAEIDYKSPARYGDLIKIETKINHLGKASIEFGYEIMKKDGAVILKAITVMGCVGKDMKPKRIPDGTRKELEKAQNVK